ncbi:MFS transporter [Pseudonocardia sp. MH-G8]|uniref:MFS transporter n=1 Tax=Pseudonocardia sp. MH-G8 TaxID=1854588 RepID=UPI001E539B23|nr:MFS transporter [Pseudonocardia sp. MH-G8]
MTSAVSARLATRPGYRWVVLAVCWAAFTMTSADRATWGPAAGAVGADLGVPVAALGVFATCYYVGYVVSVATWGFLADWVGARLTVALSIALSGAFMIGFGEVRSHAWGLALQLLIGLCAGAEVGAGSKLITVWFGSARLGTAMGVFMTATSLGLVIANAIVPTLVQEFSWRASYHLFGAVSIALGVAAYILIRMPAGAATRATGREGLPDLRPLLHNRDLVLLALAGFGALWGTYGFITWSNLLMVKGIGISPVTAGIVVVVFGSVAIFSKPLIGVVSDRVRPSRQALSAWILVAFAAALIAFSFARTPFAFLLIAPLLGLAAYTYSPLMMAMIPTASGTRLAGSATGGVNAFWQLGSAIVPTVLGLVFATSGSFHVAFLALAAGPALAIIPLLLIGRGGRTA